LVCFGPFSPQNDEKWGFRTQKGEKMAWFNSTDVEKEGLSLAEKAGEAVLTKIASNAVAGKPPASGLVALVVQAVTDHVLATGSAPNLELLKTSIGQLIEGTVGVLQATGKLSVAKAAEVNTATQGIITQTVPKPAPPVIG